MSAQVAFAYPDGGPGFILHNKSKNQECNFSKPDADMCW